MTSKLPVHCRTVFSLHPRHLYRVPAAFASAGLAALLMAASPAAAADQDLTITIRNHKFEPAHPEVKAGQRIKLTVVNADSTAEEFESRDFNVEKIVGGGKTVTLFVGPLDPGTYRFFGERHESTAHGTLTVK